MAPVVALDKAAIHARDDQLTGLAGDIREIDFDGLFAPLVAGLSGSALSRVAGGGRCGSSPAI